MKKLISVVSIHILSLNLVACSNVNKEQGITIYDENAPVENLEKLSIKELEMKEWILQGVSLNYQMKTINLVSI